MNKVSVMSGLVLCLYGSLSSGKVWAHGDARLGVEPVNETAFSAGQISYDFQILDLKRKIVLKDADFNSLNDQKVHLFVYDPGLKKLQHLNAKYTGSAWHVDLSLAQDGNYWVWAEGELAFDKTDGYGSTRLQVTHGSPMDTVGPEVEEKRVGSDGTSQVKLSMDPIVKEKEAMLMLTYSRRDGSAPQITPFLGEMGQAIIVSEDGDWLSHSHVMSRGPEMLMLHVTFPEEGNYRIWVQYLDAGILKTVSLAVAVGASSEN